MTERFFIADLHWGHEKTCTTFKLADGITPLRPFANAQEMDEEMVKRWNAAVGPRDKVEVLGDWAIGRKHIFTGRRLNGRKRLRMGNHDIFPHKDYLEVFEEISAYKVFEDLFCSHVPIHEDSLKQRWTANVHGHYHANVVTRKTRAGERPHPRYLCVSVEHTDFTPISFDEVRARIKKQREEFGKD